MISHHRIHRTINKIQTLFSQEPKRANSWIMFREFVHQQCDAANENSEEKIFYNTLQRSLNIRTDQTILCSLALDETHKAASVRHYDHCKAALNKYLSNETITRGRVM